MSLGSSVRRRLGRHERRISSLYRGIFMSLNGFEKSLSCAWPAATSILEVGCGEGQVTEMLARIYPDAEVLGIDLIAQPGRLFAGDRSRVSFRQIEVGQLSVEAPRRYDLVVVADVIHHVPPAGRELFLQQTVATLSPGGAFLLKDWARSGTPIHWLGYFSDRFITGDRVQYCTVDELRDLVLACLPQAKLHHEWHIPPWRNNIAFVISAT